MPSQVPYLCMRKLRALKILVASASRSSPLISPKPLTSIVWLSHSSLTSAPSCYQLKSKRSILELSRFPNINIFLNYVFLFMIYELANASLYFLEFFFFSKTGGVEFNLLLVGPNAGLNETWMRGLSHRQIIPVRRE